MHEQVNLLARPQLCNEDVVVHRADGALREEVGLVPQRHPRHVSGIHSVVDIELIGVRGVFSSVGVPRAPDLQPELQGVDLCATFVSCTKGEGGGLTALTETSAPGTTPTAWHISLILLANTGRARVSVPTEEHRCTPRLVMDPGSQGR